MNFKTLLATASAFVPVLATAHDQMVVELDCIGIKTGIDLAYVHRRIPIMAQTFVPPQHRDAVIESLQRLNQRVSDAGHLKKPDRLAVKEIIASAVETITAQPEKMTPSGNGRPEEIPRGGFMAEVARTCASDEL